MLRGPEEDKEGVWESKEFALTREVVKIESVQSWIQQPGIGYLRLIEFSGRTAEDALRRSRASRARAPRA